MDNWWQRSNPDEIKVAPWISPEATEFLESILKPDFEVLEHGSGGSTLWMAERVKMVYAFENNKGWKKKIEDYGKKNIVIGESFDFVPTGKLLGGKADLLFIDGEPVEDRQRWIMSSLSLVKPGGWIVLDNANRPEYAIERDWLVIHAEETVTINGNTAGTRYLVTEFFRVGHESRE